MIFITSSFNKNKKDLDDSMYELLHKIATAADDRHCFSDDTTIQSLDEEDRYGVSCRLILNMEFIIYTFLKYPVFSNSMTCISFRVLLEIVLVIFFCFVKYIKFF